MKFLMMSGINLTPPFRRMSARFKKKLWSETSTPFHQEIIRFVGKDGFTF
jgi:hypothetical protein